MKRYKIKITHEKTKAVLYEGDEIANTEKSIKTKYRIKYPFAKIKVSRMVKKPGTQIDLEDLIKEQEQSNE